MIEVTPHIYAIKIPFQIPISPEVRMDRFVYAYLIQGRKLFLVDTGVAASRGIIFEAIREMGRTPEDLSWIILTHSHPDHIGSAKAIQEASGCKVAAHSSEKAWIENIQIQFQERSVPGFHTLVGGSVPVNQFLKEGDVLDLGDDLELEIYHTPGHSKGSIALYLRKENALFAGDAIPLPGDLPIYEDVMASIESIKKLQTLGKVDFLLSSWDDPKEGESVSERIEEGLTYLQRIHRIVIKTVENLRSQETAPP